MKLTPEQVEQFRKAAQPLVDFLQQPEICHPHCTVIVTSVNAELVEGVTGQPFPLKDPS